MSERKRNPLSHEFIRFLGVGGSATAIDFAIYMLLRRVLPPSLAKLVSMCCSCLYSYCLNKAWTFRDRRRTSARLILRFALAQLANIGANVGTNAFFLSVLNAPVLIAFAFATGAGMAVNYTLQRMFVFKKRSASREDV